MQHLTEMRTEMTKLTILIYTYTKDYGDGVSTKNTMIRTIAANILWPLSRYHVLF